MEHKKPQSLCMPQSRSAYCQRYQCTLQLTSTRLEKGWNRMKNNKKIIPSSATILISRYTSVSIYLICMFVSALAKYAKSFQMVQVVSRVYIPILSIYVCMCSLFNYSPNGCHFHPVILHVVLCLLIAQVSGVKKSLGI